MKKYIKTAGFLLFVVLLAGCGKKEVLFAGKTMGTTYHIKVVTGYFNDASHLRDKIIRRLEEINRSMSTYMKDSEISRFNAMKSTEEKFYISDDFLQVMIAARYLHEITDGAWDGTIKPLINLWGFGNSEGKNHVPQAEEINALLADTGFDQIDISGAGYLKKKNPAISLDLASIAKGYGVDQVAKLIETNRFRDFLVEIGGEVRASGFRKDGRHWRVGINMPSPKAAYNEVYKAVNLHDRAFATSGDYRIFFEADDKRYSHILDPATGYPVINRVVSTSVMAPTCILADGLATALMVSGHERGIELANRLADTECLIVVQEKDGAFTDYYSKEFEKFKVQSSK